MRVNGLPPTLLVALLAALALSVTGCEKDERPCLLMIVMDTTRADRLGCYGHEAAATATLDSLAAAGVRFANAITSTPVTGPAIATILSGVSPPVHGMRDNARFVLNEELPLLAEAFASAGYQTGAVVAALPIAARFGFAQGFAHFDDRFADDPYEVHNPAFAEKQDGLQTSERRAAAVTDRALAWLRKSKKGRPFFLLAHYYDAHGPYDPPPALARRHRDAYDGEIAYMDTEIGRLLAGVREWTGDRRTIRVVAIGDHGEGLYDHQEWTHGFFVYDATVRVPLIVCGDGARPGLEVESDVRTEDIAATLCAWFSLPAPRIGDGADLTAALAGNAVPAACGTIYLETFLTQYQHEWSPLQGVRTGRWKWIKAPRPELYDLSADPGETTNLAGTLPDRERELADMTAELLIRAETEARLVGASPSEIDPQVARQLESLGYVSAPGRRSLEPDFSLPDPKDGNRDWNRDQEFKKLMITAQLAFHQGDLQKALDDLTAADRIEPLASRDAAMRGEILARLERHTDAVAAFRQALRSEIDVGGRGFIRLRIARSLVALGSLREAEAEIDTLRARPNAPASFKASVDELAAEIAKRR